MSDTAAEPIILKILTGVQSGVDVFLTDGTYSLGSGEEDDIQVLDVSLLPGHVRLRVREGRVALAGGAGPASTTLGTRILPNGEFADLEPLDVVWAGTTRFTTGLPSANWSSLSQEPPPVPVKLRRSGLRKRHAVSGVVESNAGRLRWAVPLAVVLAALGAAAATLPVGGSVGGAGGSKGRGSIEAVREAIAALPFARNVEARAEVDGEVFVTGFVATPAERRAVLADTRAADPAVRLRVGVLDSMKGEIAQLLSVEAPGIDFTLSDRGEVTLRGTILDPAEAGRVAALVADNVIGVASLTSEIETRDTLLAAVRRLAERSQIAPLTILRLDGSLIEMSGVVPTEKVDAWVGFLQAYTAQYAPQIALRSLVRLQNPDGTMQPAPTAGSALVIGSAALAQGDVRLDTDRLVSGTYDLADVFAGQPASPPALVTETASPAEAAVNVSRVLGGAQPGPVTTGGIVAAPRVVGVETPLTAEPGRRTGDAQDPLATAAGAGSAGLYADDDTVRRLLRTWGSGHLPRDPEGRRLGAALEALARAAPGTDSPAALSQRYAPIRRPGPLSDADLACWPTAKLTEANVAGTLFWLDLLSVSEDLSLGSIEAATRPLVLEAALNPRRLDSCARRAGLSIQSVYLDEVARNPGFVNFITRDLSDYPLDIAGANVGQDRFVQLRGGEKLREGAAPDRNSRIASVGELGVAVDRGGDGFSAVIFGTSVNWIVR
ncbi:BON domain-containing protein [uncultured Aureimonas sp.]|uniref:BON domain-containing protein n=1 Tax=uncultured Aureimonas sp. TaxID=1604662 RepID=UPI0025F15C4A|nr:BON domain-containing protein [uncultured Aureimonas sp.]